MKAEAAYCEPQLCPDKHSALISYLQESTFVLYKCFVMYLIMQQKLKVAEKLMGILHKGLVNITGSGKTKSDQREVRVWYSKGTASNVIQLEDRIYTEL